jgi:hypothetical protein
MADRVTFTPPADGGPVTAYSLLRASSAEGPFEPVATIGADADSFTSAVETAGDWFYRVAASGPGGPGPLSDIVTNDRVLMSATVGSEGALLRSSNGEVILQLASDSFATPTNVTVSEVAGSPSGGLLSLAGMYELAPSGTLGAPARLSVRYTLNVAHFQVAEALLAEASLMTYSGGSWMADASNVRAADGYLSGDLSHFSYWTAAVVQPHGTSATTYCSDGTFCHNLSEYPGATTRYASRDSQVCFNCHGNSDLALGPAGATGENVEASLNGLGIVSRHPVASGDLYCTFCHDAHADPASSPGMLRAIDAVTGLYIQGGGGNSPGDTYCWACHGPVRNRRTDYLVAGYWTRTLGDHRTGYASSAHGSLTSEADITCTLCHAEHGSVNDNLLAARLSGSTEASVAGDRATGEYAQACLKCHDGTWAAKGAADIKRHVTSEAARTDLMASGGHRIKSAGGLLPVNAPLPCDSCHGPHGTKRGNATLLSDVLGANLKTTSAADVRKFCFTCHVTPDLYGWDSTAGAYAAVSAGATVQGLPRNGGVNGSGPNGSGYNWLRLKSISGHARTDANSCYECHGNDYSSASGNNVHNPGSYSVALHTASPANATITIKGTTYGPYACSMCHDLELGPEHAKASASSGAAECGACHPAPRSSLVPSWTRTTCTQGNCHAGTSPDPMHSTIDADHTTTGPCSTTNCHSTSAAAIHNVAGGPGCVACHGPGITPTLACASCHANPHPNSATLNHGEADICSSCHSVGKITGIHGDDCAKCHPSRVTGATVYTSCTQANCHVPGTEHSGMAGYPTGDHEPPHGDYGYCWDCHPEEGGGCPSCHTWDRYPPVTTSNAQADYLSGAVITLSVTEPTIASGIKATYYQVDGGPIQTGTLIVVPGPSAGARHHSIEFWSEDNAFNTEAHKVAHFTVAAGVDNVAPTGTMSVNNGAAYSNSTNVTINSAVTDVGAGVSAMRIDPGTGTFGAWIPYSATQSITMPGGNGTKNVRAEYRDVSNNTLALADSIVLDMTPPTGTVNVNNNAIYTNSLTVTLYTSGITDALSGVTEMSINGNGSSGPWIPFAASATTTIGGGTGTRYIYATFRDAAGNTYTTYDTITLDGVLPTGTMSVNNGAPSTNNTSASVNSAVSDANSGIDVMRVDPGTGVFGSWVAYSASYNITLPSGAGTKTVRAEYRDRAGNVLALTDTIYYDTTLDPIPPTGTIVINGGATWTNSLSASLTLSASDTGGSGVYDMRFSNNNVDWSGWEAYATSKTWTMTTGIGLKTVYVQYRDAVGNISTGTTSDTISWEGTVPTGGIVINGGAAWTDNQTVTLSLTYADAGGSGIADMRFSNDYSTWSAWEPVAASKSWSITPGAAVKTVYAQYRDGAGNISSNYVDTIAYLLNQTLTYSAGAGGTISGTAVQTVHNGESGTTVTAVPNAGYRFLGWSDLGSTPARGTNPSRTDTNVQYDVNATAWFAPTSTYTITFLDDGGGCVVGQWIQGVPAGGSTTPVGTSTYQWMFDGWSNGVTWLGNDPLVLTNVQANATWTAYFTSSGSCPFLYTWDGSRFVFEADEFAAGYLALRTSKGYRRPNPIDYHVTATKPAAKDGALEYRLVEEREETDYLDQVKLYTVDAPSDREVYVERSQAEGVGMFTTLDAVIHTTALNLEPPQSVLWLNTGQEVRDLVAASDGERVVLNDDRNAGFNYQTLELDLGDVQSAPMVKLVIDGRTMIPTSTEGRAYSRTFGPQAKLEVQDAAGNWVLVPSTKAILPKPPEFDRPFVLNLTNVWISDSRKVRLTYLYKTYIDSILLDTTADAPVTITELPLTSADLQPHGFDARTGMGEWYDYVYGDAVAPPRYRLPGNYTKFGETSPLLQGVDDKFVIFGGGDELVLRFEPPKTGEDGITRRYLFFSNGYYKSRKEDIPHTVEPLPFAAMSNYPYPATESYPTDAEHQAYLSEWNTRYEGE